MPNTTVPITSRRSRLALAVLLATLGAMPGAAAAQTVPATKPVVTAEPGAQPETTTATYQDWVVRCTVTADKLRACEIVQNLKVEGQGLVASLAIGKAEPKSPLRLVVQLPAGVWLPAGVTLLASDKAKPLQLGYRRCLQACFADIELDAATLQLMRTATEPGSFSFEDGARRPVKLPISFKGLQPALDASLKS